MTVTGAASGPQPWRVDTSVNSKLTFTTAHFCRLNLKFVTSFILGDSLCVTRVVRCRPDSRHDGRGAGMGRRQNGRETENSETKQARSKVDDWIKNTSHLPQETPPSEMDPPRLTPWPSLRRSASDLNVTTPRSSLLERAIVRSSSRERIAGMARVSRLESIPSQEETF